MSMDINLSNDQTITCDLVVYKDWTESNGKWRLFWANQDDPWKGVQEQSTVCGQPFFNRRYEAVAYAQRRYNLTPTTAVFHEPN